MSYWMPRLGEGVRALVVLALVFLNFGHLPVAAAGVPAWAGPVCGTPADLELPAKQPVAHQCDVCLVGSGFALPPAPPALVPPRGELRLAGAAAPAAMPAAWHYGQAQPRAPPAA